MTSKVLGLVVAAAAVVFQGCASDEPRELGREGEDVGTTYEDDQAGVPADQQGQRGGVWNGEQGGASTAVNQLDGKTYTVQLNKEGEAAVQDTLIFKDGMVESTACRAKGFGPAPYTVTTGQAGAMTFNATARAGEKTMHWDGKIQGDRIQGTAVSYEAGNAEPSSSTFQGSLKAGAANATESSGALEGKDKSETEGDDQSELEGDETKNPATKDPSGRRPNAGPM